MILFEAKLHQSIFPLKIKRIVLLVRELFIYVFNMYLFDERNLFILPWWPINLYLTVLDKDGQMILLDLILP